MVFGKRLGNALISNLLEKRGYCLKETALPPAGFKKFLDFYKSFAPYPKTVIDIGVGNGTPWLYEGFSNSRLVLFEALTEFKPSIDRILETREGTCNYCALSERDGTLEIHVPNSGSTGASILERNADWAALKAARGDKGISKRSIPAHRLDGIVGDVQGPYVIKIDVEGAELHVLRGGEKTASGADMIIVEASIATRHTGESDLTDIAAYLKTLGFALFDIIEMAPIRRGGPLAYVDAAFIRKDADFYTKAVFDNV